MHILYFGFSSVLCASRNIIRVLLLLITRTAAARYRLFIYLFIYLQYYNIVIVNSGNGHTFAWHISNCELCYFWALTVYCKWYLYRQGILRIDLSGTQNAKSFFLVYLVFNKWWVRYEVNSFVFLKLFNIIPQSFDRLSPFLTLS